MKPGDKVRFKGSIYSVEKVFDSDKTVQIANTLHRGRVSQVMVRLIKGQPTDSFEYMAREYKNNHPTENVVTFSTEEELIEFLESSNSNGKIYRAEVIDAKKAKKSKLTKKHRLVHDAVLGLFFLVINCLMVYLCWEVRVSENNLVLLKNISLIIMPCSTVLFSFFAIREVQKVRDKTILEFMNNLERLKVEIHQACKLLKAVLQTKQFWIIQIFNVLLLIRSIIKQIMIWVGTYLLFVVIYLLIRAEGGRLEILEAVLSIFGTYIMCLPLLLTLRLMYLYGCRAEGLNKSEVVKLLKSFINLVVYNVAGLFESSTYTRVFQNEQAITVYKMESFITFITYCLGSLLAYLVIEICLRIFLKRVVKGSNILLAANIYQRTKEMPETKGTWGAFVRINAIKEVIHDRSHFKPSIGDPVDQIVDYSIRYSFIKGSIISAKALSYAFDQKKT